MKTNLLFMPWNLGAQAVKDIKKEIGGQTILPGRHATGNYHFGPNDFVVMWGHGDTPYWGNGVGPNKRILNHWSAIHLGVNKLRSFVAFKDAGVPIPEYTKSIATAKKWIEEGEIVLCRKLLSSREGKGIVIAKKASDLVEAPLYVKLVPKENEYRIHVFNGKVIDFAQKKLRNGYKEIKGRDQYVRNTANGWIFARIGVEVSDAAKKAAIAATKAVGLDFAAVDLATTKKGGVIVFEVNTAPGIEGTTIQTYAKAIEEYRKSL